jgi:hypothetical protein
MISSSRAKGWVVVVVLGVVSAAVWDGIKVATANLTHTSLRFSFVHLIDVAYSVGLASFAYFLGARKKKEPTTMPELRPKVVPVRWGRSSDNHCGLFLRNDGEPAFDISIEEPVPIGEAKLQFWNRVHPGLTKANGEILAEAHIELSTGYGLTADGLRELMVKADLESAALKINYRSLEGQRWVTHCDLINEVWGAGIRVGGVRQECVT